MVQLLIYFFVVLHSKEESIFTLSKTILFDLQTPATLKGSSINKIIVFHLKRLKIVYLIPFLDLILKIFFCIYTRKGAKI